MVCYCRSIIYFVLYLRYNYVKTCFEAHNKTYDINKQESWLLISNAINESLK